MKVNLREEDLCLGGSPKKSKSVFTGKVKAKQWLWVASLLLSIIPASTSREPLGQGGSKNVEGRAE